MSGESKGGGYTVRPWDGRDVAPGASRGALDQLAGAGIFEPAEGEREGTRTPLPDVATNRSPVQAKVRAAPTRQPLNTAAPQHVRTSAASAPRRTPPERKTTNKAAPVSEGRKASGRTVARTIRLTPRVDGCLLQLADALGIDLNAAVSVAIAEDYFDFTHALSVLTK